MLKDDDEIERCMNNSKIFIETVADLYNVSISCTEATDDELNNSANKELHMFSKYRSNTQFPWDSSLGWGLIPFHGNKQQMSCLSH